MLKRLLFIAALLCAWPSYGAIARVQVKSGHAAANSSTTMSVTPTGATTAGNTVVVTIHYGRCTGCTVPHTISSVTDSGGSTYAQRAGPIQSAANQRTEIWSTAAASAVASTTISVALVGDAAATFLSMEIEELSGVLALGNATATGTTGNSTTSSVSVTSQNANNWVIAGAYNDSCGAVFTSVSGTIRAQDDGGACTITGDSVIMDIGPAAGSQTLSWTDTADNWQATALEVCAQSPCSGGATQNGWWNWGQN